MSPAPPPRSASPPILASAQAPTTGAEIRPLEPERCVLSIDDRHFTIDVPAEVAQTLLLLWRCGRGDLIGEDLARAAEPLRRLVADGRTAGPARPSLEPLSVLRPSGARHPPAPDCGRS